MPPSWWWRHLRVPTADEFAGAAVWTGALPAGDTIARPCLPGPAAGSRRGRFRSEQLPGGHGGTIEAKRLFYGDASSVGDARLFVREALAVTDAPAHIVDSAVLLVSELATNVALHAHTDLQVTLRFEDDTLWGEVKDWNPRLPQPCTAPEGATAGRGLALVEAIATRWGMERDRDGKLVWFFLESDHSASGGGQ